MKLSLCCVANVVVRPLYPDKSRSDTASRDLVDDSPECGHAAQSRL